MRPSDQMSIKELDLAKFEEVLLDDIDCRRLVIEFADAIGPDTAAQIDTYVRAGIR
jgi:hypothetical protein